MFGWEDGLLLPVVGVELTVFGWENGLVVDGLLDVGHQQVHVLRRGKPSLLSLLVHP